MIASGAPSMATETPAPRARPSRTLSAEELLTRALRATTPRQRAKWALQGLGRRTPLDPTTQAMLLRQLYLAHFELRQFEQASAVAEQALTLDVLPDVVHQDVARARQALGDIDGAATHLRMAARVGPASRRAFHQWTLGSTYYLAGRHEEAVNALRRSLRWSTTARPLYEAHLALARVARGDTISALDALIDDLATIPAGQGYGRFVLGQLAYHAGRYPEARRYLSEFVRRTSSGRPVLALALSAELDKALETLSRMPVP